MLLQRCICDHTSLRASTTAAHTDSASFYAPTTTFMLHVNAKQVTISVEIVLQCSTVAVYLSG